MIHDSRLPNPAPLRTDELVVRSCKVAIARPAAATPEPVQDGEAARVSVDVCDRQAERIYQLERRIEALENKLDGDIMRWKEIALAFKRGFLDVVGTINGQFGLNTK